MSFNCGDLSWCSSLQSDVTLSSAEAEFIAASEAGQVVVYTASARNRSQHFEASKMVSVFLYVFHESSKRVSTFDRESKSKPWRLGKAPTQLPLA